MTCQHPHGALSRIPGRRHQYVCHACDRLVTARNVGLNPRALGTNPRARRRRQRGACNPACNRVQRACHIGKWALHA
jgi:hypothetical protein